jgi:hypothetical protein
MAHPIGYKVSRPRTAVTFDIGHSRSEHSIAAKGECTVTDFENEIAENDMLRRSFEGGCVEISHDIAASDVIESILDGVRNYDSFAEHQNEQDDHAFGLIHFDEGWIFWEISKCEKSGPRPCKCPLKKVLKIYHDYEM